MKQEENLGWRRIIYWAVIFSMLTIFFWTVSMYESDEAFKLFSFAATITSIVLACVSIVLSLVSSVSTYKNLGSMRDASEAITDVSHDLGHIKDGLNNDIERLTHLETEMQNTQNGIKQILQVTRDIQQRINPAERNTNIQQGDLSSGDNFVFKKTSIVGKCIIYACMLSTEKGKPFPAAMIGNPSYVHGYITALETCAPSHFRATSEANGYIVVTYFDNSFFSDITKEKIQAEVNTNGLYAEMKTILDNIHTFFSVV